MSHRDDPPGIVDEPGTEMSVGRRAQGDLVRELTSSRRGTSDDSSFDGGGPGHGGKSQEKESDTEFIHLAVKKVGQVCDRPLVVALLL